MMSCPPFLCTGSWWVKSLFVFFFFLLKKVDSFLGLKSVRSLDLEDVPLVEFVYLVFTHMPVRVTVGDPGLCCCTCVTYVEP